MTRIEESKSLSDEKARAGLYGLLHDSISRKHPIDQVVNVGSDYLDIDHGRISDINQTKNRWEVIGSTDSPD